MIEVSHVSRTFGTFRAVNDVSFSIPTGQIVGLLGPNGAGKTTTMRMITGFLKPTDGSIKIDGIDISENPVESKRKIGYMPESAPLYGEMIVEDYLRYVAELEGKNADEKVPLLCKECGLKEVMHKNIGELSRGYRQRVGLAHALMNDPEILILDEPTSGLDPNQIEDVRTLIKEIGKTRTVIISTHILSEVEMLCDRVIIISKGTIVADSPTQELQSRYAQKSILKVQLTDYQSAQDVKDGLSKIEGILSIANSEIHDEKLGKILKLELSIDDGAEIRGKIAREIIEKNLGSLIELNLEKNTLEDVFKSLTSEGESDEN